MFAADKDKSKYNDIYLQKMKVLQKEYDERLGGFAKASGYILVKGV